MLLDYEASRAILTIWSLWAPPSSLALEGRLGITSMKVLPLPPVPCPGYLSHILPLCEHASGKEIFSLKKWCFVV